MQINLSRYSTKRYLYPCESHVFCHSKSVLLHPGTYLIQCFGASGGDSGEGIGGYGAYVAGLINIKKAITVYLYIGAEGHLELGNTSYNGGGRAHLNPSTESQGASGGGSTDIRLLDQTDIEGLLSRIIVAGGGAGAESYNSKGGKGGDAGGLEGEKGVKISKGTTNQITVGEGGSQTQGGAGGLCIKTTDSNTCPNGHNGHDGTFGYGGNASDYSYGSGGGGGYFGGGGGSVAGSIVSTGGGGSSYMSGYENCHSFILDDELNLLDINSSFHHSGFEFIPILFKNGTEAKHKGNGKVLITLIENYQTFYCKSILNMKLLTLTCFLFNLLK